MDLRDNNRINAEFSMSSMTDIVFLLLIFFILTSSRRMTYSIDLVLNHSDGAQVKENLPSVSVVKY
ncbi:MAG: ExbD/TolR family protein [Flavobacteriales bacterium AspAUS03]